MRSTRRTPLARFLTFLSPAPLVASRIQSTLQVSIRAVPKSALLPTNAGLRKISGMLRMVCSQVRSTTGHTQSVSIFVFVPVIPPYLACYVDFSSPYRILAVQRRHDHPFHDWSTYLDQPPGVRSSIQRRPRHRRAHVQPPVHDYFEQLGHCCASEYDCLSSPPLPTYSSISSVGPCRSFTNPLGVAFLATGDRPTVTLTIVCAPLPRR